MLSTTMYLTIIFCSLILVFLIYFLAKPDDRNVVSAPSILASFGIFGTFLGIAIGLMNFDARDIVASVPVFMGGIKLAFWSSVVGIMAAIVHRFRFLIYPLDPKRIPDDVADSRTLESLDKVNNSLESLIGLSREHGTADRDLREFGENLVALGDKIQTGLQSMAGSLADGFGNVTQGVSQQANMLTEQLRGMAHDVSAQARVLADELKADESILNMLTELRGELAKNSQEEQFVVKNQIQKLLDASKEDAKTKAKLQSDAFLEVFDDLQKQIESGSKLTREVTTQQMDQLLSGLSRAAAGTLGEFSEIAGKIIEQAKWQGANIAGQITEATETSTKSMLRMLERILATTEDSNRRVVNELAKLRTDVAADMRAGTEQSKALVEQLQAMTESYKASLIAITTDLKTQISKDMKASYGLIDTYTKNVAELTGSNQMESLERLGAIANIMQSVVESSSDMAALLHDNTVAMTHMQETFTGTNEGSLGRFFLNMNEKIIEQLSSLESSLAAQGSLGTLMQDLNTELLKRFRALEKLSEASILEARQLPKEIAKGFIELKQNSVN